MFLPFLCLIFYVTNIECLWYKVCDGNTVNLSCDPGEVLKIKASYYCAENFNCCCAPDFSYYSVSKLCHNQQCCVFPCAKYMFAGQCPAERKCIHIQYYCKVNKTSEAEKCRINEEWSDCRSACPKMCPDKNNPQPKFCTKQCVCPGYQCKHGYLRDAYTGTCVKCEYCPNPDDKHEKFSKCANKQEYCEIWYKPSRNVTTTTENTENKCCEPGYSCKAPYVRDPFSKYCVLKEGCPVF